jgi:cytochrome c556
MAAIGLLAAASAAVAAPAIIEDRIGNFRDIGSAFKNIGDELKTGRPNVARVRTSARVIRDYSTHVPAWFPANSQPAAPTAEGFIGWLRNLFTPADVGEVKSHAKPEIWTRPAQFRKATVDFQAAAQRLYDASESGNVAGISAQYRVMGGACQRCHDGFREKLK